MSVATVSSARLSLQSLTLMEEDVEPYVLAWPDQVLEVDGHKEALVFPLLKREDGVLLAVPVGFLPQEQLDAANLGEDSHILGLSTIFTVPSVLLDGGPLSPTGTSVDLVVVDCSAVVVDMLRPVEPFEDIAFGFDPDSTFNIPDREALLPLVMNWIQESHQGSTLVFYSAAEGMEKDESGAKKTATPKKARAPRGKAIADGGTPQDDQQRQKPKKPTTASLSASLENLMTALPGLTQQVQELAQRQKSLEEKMVVPSPGSFHALQRPLWGYQPWLRKFKLRPEHRLPRTLVC